MTFPISPALRAVLDAIVSGGGRPAIIGGAIRDWIMGYVCKDIDVEVYGIPVEALEAALSSFKVDAVGKSFGVLKVTVEGETFDVSLPRRESKEGRGHKGFLISADPTMSPAEAAARRDFTVNTVGWDYVGGKLIDFHGGVRDIKAKVLRHTSPAFAEDPLRVLRGVQFAARFGFEMLPETVALCRTLVGELQTLPVERLWTEWTKLLVKGREPSRGLHLLVETGAVDLFPEVKALLGMPQDPVWHPEGWSLTLTTPLVDAGVAVAVAAQESVRDLFTRLAARTATGERRSFPPSNSIPGLVAAAGAPATGARKVHRVMLEVPLPSVNRIVASALDDLKVLEAIVRPIFVYVMNVLMPGQPPVELEFHQEAVERNGPLASGPTGVPVPVSIVVDARSAAIDGHVLCTIDFAVFDADVHASTTSTQIEWWKATMASLWVHNCMVTDMAVKVLDQDGVTDPEERMIVMLGAFCHDFGKPSTTKFERKRWRSLGHEEAGEAPTRSFLARIGAPPAIIEAVVPLVQHHLKPFVFGRSPHASPSAVRRLALKAPLVRLCQVARADFWGRTTPEALAVTDSRKIEETCWLLAKAEELAVRDAAPKPILLGRHLLELGMKPGKNMGVMLKAAFEAQLDGTFDDEGGAIAWAQQNLVNQPTACFDPNKAPRDDAFTVLDMLKLLASDDNNRILTAHPAFKYSRIGRGRVDANTVLTDKEQAELDSLTQQLTGLKDPKEAAKISARIAEITNKPEALKFEEDEAKAAEGYSVSNLVYNSDRPNVSLLVRKEGKVNLASRKDKPASVPMDFSTFIFRNYTIIKDGLVNVETLPVKLSKATVDALTKLHKDGLIPDNVISGAKAKLVADGMELTEVILNFAALPVVNGNMVKSVSAKALFEAEYAMAKAKAAQKVYNAYKKEKQPEGKKSEGFEQQYGADAAAWLKAQGFTDYSGFCPKSMQAESTDFYMAKELLVSFKGLSSLPTLKEVREKMAKGKLTASAALMAPFVTEVEDYLSANCKVQGAEADAAFIRWIDQKAKDQTAEVRKQMFAIAQMKFAVIVGQVWFSEFKSIDENTMTLKIDGNDVEAKVEMKETKQII